MYGWVLGVVALLAAYAGLWTFPAPAEVPTDLRDPEVRLELRRRLAPVEAGFELGDDYWHVRAFGSNANYPTRSG